MQTNQVYSLHETFVSSGWNFFFLCMKHLFPFGKTAVSSKQILPDEPKNRLLRADVSGRVSVHPLQKEIRLSADCAQADDKLTSG